MANISREQVDQVLLLRFSGSITEADGFDELHGCRLPEVHVNCKGVTRINTSGIRAWIKCFNELRSRGIKLRFMECSVPIVEQMNLMINFVEEDEIVSLFVPFVCTKCKTESVHPFRAIDLRHMNKQLPQMVCPNCGGRVVFDNVPEEYFVFLDR
jgi:DNA-directed RNA polymerase subunit RPC12/RpoP